jgi:hypothetical protein
MTQAIFPFSIDIQLYIKDTYVLTHAQTTKCVLLFRVYWLQSFPASFNPLNEPGNQQSRFLEDFI